MGEQLSIYVRTAAPGDAIVNATVWIMQNKHGYWFVRIMLADGRLANIPITTRMASTLKSEGIPIYAPPT